MINTFADTDTDLYDDFNNKIRRRRKKGRFIKGGRRPPIRFTIKGFPVKIKRHTKQRPKVIKGKPTKLPPIIVQTIKNTGVISPNKAIKTPITKKKIAINELIKKTAVTKQAAKTITSTNKDESVKQTAPTANKKAMESDSKVGKVVKVITGIAIVGLTGFGIYKYIQYRKKQNIHIKK